MVGGAGLIRTRFAPSPTGHLHLGHAYAAIFAHQAADPGEFLLRIEDIDQSRCRPEYEQAILHDLTWLGLDWQKPVMRQSDRMEAYRAALEKLAPYSYPCRCQRSDIRAALSAPQEGALPVGPDGLVYPGTCRHRALSEAGPEDVIRLDVGRAFDALEQTTISFTDRHQGADNTSCTMDRTTFLAKIGDIILSRRGMGTSYHLSVVVDDADQEITLVTRGIDLFESTWIHVLLQRLLALPTPDYAHHRLIRDGQGKRLAKRDDARSLRSLRAEGVTAQDLVQGLGL